MGLLQGLFGNYSEVSVEELQKKFGAYLMEGEVIENGFKLVRDTLIFTNLRIPFLRPNLLQNDLVDTVFE